MDIAKLAKHGHTQSISLPRTVHVDAEEVVVKQVGQMVLLYPKDRGWDVLEQGIEHFSEDFMEDRDQPQSPDQREGL